MQSMLAIVRERGGAQSWGGGENVARGQRSAVSVMNAWMNSAGHRANILNSRYKNIGVGLSDSGFYWTQVFGTPASSMGDGCNSGPAPAPTPTLTPEPTPAPTPAMGCATIAGGAAPSGRACVFPFKLSGKTYNACTSDLDVDGRFWCSTQVDNQGNHVTGTWGYCNSKCAGATPTIPVTPAPTPTPVPAPVTTPSPTTPANPSPSPRSCRWSLSSSNSYCGGTWGIHRKRLGSVSATVAQCQALAEADPACSDVAYSNGGSQCRCVLAGQTCQQAPSASGNSVYTKTCDQPTPAPTPPPTAAPTAAPTTAPTNAPADPVSPCVSDELVQLEAEYQKKVAALEKDRQQLQARLMTLSAQISAAERNRMRKLRGTAQ